MFKIADGREHFYQWDYDCQLIVTDPVSQVHFCNRTSTEALVLDVYEDHGQILVDVPNILLQDNWDMNVYAYDDNYTKYEVAFKIYPRNKPADYVYTETEVATWEKLEQRMDEIEATVTAEGIAKAVDNYLQENPIEAGATAEEAAQIEANTAAIEELKNANYLTESELEDKGYITGIPEEYVTENELSSKGFLTQIPAEYVTDAELTAKGYLTEHQSLANYPTWGDMGSALEDKVTTEQLNTSIADFVTETDMNIAIQNALSTLVDGDEVSY